MSRRIDVETDHVAQLGNEVRVVRELELPHPVRLQAMTALDALHRADTDPGGLGHRRPGPVGRFCGALRSRTTASSRRRSSAVTAMLIPVRMT